MLAFLTDEHISHAVADQLKLKRPDIRIESILQWREGALRSTDDNLILAAAKSEQFTLITYDQKTIPPILMELAANGDHHHGVVFADRGSLPSDNIGRLVEALIALHDRFQDLDWTDTVMFLTPISK